MGAERIFLIGMMGSGKSYWLKQMAKWNKSIGYDLDALIEMKEQKTIAEIFHEYNHNSSYKEISITLNVPAKCVDNALTRIRKKANEVYIQFKRDEYNDSKK